MEPGYIARHRAGEDQAPGFSYGVAQRWVTFEEIFREGPRRVFAKIRQGPAYKYDGCSARVSAFFDALHNEDQRERDRRRREDSASFDTVTIHPGMLYTGRHRLRKENQWPTLAQAVP